jgi:cell division protein FtsN
MSNRESMGSREVMSNRHVIAIFFSGVCLLVIAFWAGLSITRHGRSMESHAGSASPKGGQMAAATGSQEQRGSAQSQPSQAQEDQNARFIVHVATFGTAEQADRLTRELRRKYLSADTQQPGQGGDTLYRVNIGPYTSRADAEQVAHELASEGRKGIMIMEQNGSR